MSFTTPGLDGTIDRIARLLPPGLVSDTARGDLQAVAAQLPASLSDRLYFEAPLTAESRRVDLIVRVDRIARGMLTRRAHPSFEPPMPQGPIWERVRDLAVRWQSDDSVLNEAVKILWLEFDVEPGTGKQIAPDHDACPPGIFMDFTPAAYGDQSPARRFQLVAEVVAPLGDPAELRGALASARRCIDALPAGCAIVSVGILLPRGASTIRLCVLGPAEHELAACLRAIDWPGPVSDIEELCRGLDTPGDGAKPQMSLIHFDLGATVQPRVGIEYRFDRRAQVRGVIRESAFLDRLVAAGLCTPAKRDSMLAWPGCTLEQLPHELWTSVVLRRVNHVKVMYENARAPYAKGYLSMGHAFHARPGADQTPRSTQ